MKLLGLKWIDLDWIMQIIKVEGQLVRSEQGEIQFTSLKTNFGRRMVSLGSKVIEVLRNQYELQRVERRAAGILWAKNYLIFTNDIGGPLEPRNLLGTSRSYSEMQISR